LRIETHKPHGMKPNFVPGLMRKIGQAAPEFKPGIEGLDRSG
jgi:hypothetical protein